MRYKRILSLVLIVMMILPMSVMPVLAEEPISTETSAEPNVEVTAPIAVLMDGKTRKSFI